MNHYLVFNNLDEKFSVNSFTENVFHNRRELAVELKVEDVSEGDGIVSALANYLQENSITNLDLVNDADESLYTTERYTEIKTFAISLSLGDPDVNLAPSMLYVIHFVQDL